MITDHVKLHHPGICRYRWAGDKLLVVDFATCTLIRRRHYHYHHQHNRLNFRLVPDVSVIKAVPFACQTYDPPFCALKHLLYPFFSAVHPLTSTTQ
jgi:hypothetical protein